MSLPRARLAVLLCLVACTSVSAPRAADTPTPAGSTLHAESLPSPKASIPATKGPCRAKPLANVYHPDRLVVVNACKTVTGVIETIRHEPDGDFHFDLLLDRAYARLINSGNVSHQHGWLVAEIVPADEPGCTPGTPPKPRIGTYDYGLCTGADITTPPRGTHVSVTGPYVLDSTHGWMEIHPVWRIVILAA